nr:immunoglobulin light chain junction region [Macaca mulatta]
DYYCMTWHNDAWVF